MDCISCYEKYVLWQKRMSSISSSGSVTLLFIIKGTSYDEFIKQVKMDGLKETKYYTFMDPSDIFIKSNKNIPKWIIERALLIDNNNRICLIGNPFGTMEMNKIFLSIISEEYEQ